jgi:hypothetical protein
VRGGAGVVGRGEHHPGVCVACAPAWGGAGGNTCTRQGFRRSASSGGVVVFKGCLAGLHAGTKLYKWLRPPKSCKKSAHKPGCCSKLACPLLFHQSTHTAHTANATTPQCCSDSNQLDEVAAGFPHVSTAGGCQRKDSGPDQQAAAATAELVILGA